MENKGTITVDRIDRVQRSRGANTKPEFTQKKLVTVAYHPGDVIAAAIRYIQSLDLGGEQVQLTKEESELLRAYYHAAFHPRPTYEPEFSFLDWVRYLVASELLAHCFHVDQQ
jgi:hypothetical protein